MSVLTETTETEWLTPARLAQALGVPPPTPEQAAVISAPHRPALVVAGAGAGKTETMAARVVWLVATGAVLPEQVLGLTFTRKAAQQLADRVRSRLRRLAGSRLLDDIDPTGERKAALLDGDGSAVTVLTYHAYAGRLVAEHALRLPAEPGARLLSETAAWQLAHRVVSTWAADLDVDRVPATVTGYLLALAGELGEHLVEPHALRAHAEAFVACVENAPRAKGQRAALTLETRKWLDAQKLRVTLLPLVEAFTERKRAERVVDFADQMAIAARIAQSHPDVGAGERARYRAVLLDEYQDTGHAQRIMLRSLFRTGAGEDPVALTAVGDPCQSIYGWRGASAANLPRFTTDFPVYPGPEPAPRYGLLTSFRNPAEVLALANAVSEPLRVPSMALRTNTQHPPDSAAPSRISTQSHSAPEGLVEVDELRPLETAAPGQVRVALHNDVTEEIAWTADALAARWHAAVDAGDDPPTAAVLVRRRADMAPMAAALRERDVPVEVVGLGGLLAEPEVRDLVSALRLVADPLAGTAAMRLLTGARWRLGAADLAALWARARELALPAEERSAKPDALAGLVADALPGELAEQAGLVDALDDPGPPEAYSEAGYQRIRRLSTELMSLRGRAGGAGGSGWTGLPDLVADTERALLLDAETAARPGPVGRAQLDAFAEVVAEFAAGAEVPTLPALLDYLATAEQAEDGLRPGEVEVADDRVQILTVHAAKGLEWQVVAVPHLVDRVFPAAAKTGSWLTNPAELPVELRGDAPDLPDPTLPEDGDRKQVIDAIKAHKEELDARRLAEERRLLYVAITRAERTLLLSGHWWAASGDRPRGPSAFLTELNDIAQTSAEVVIEHWAEEPAEDEPNPVTAAPRTARWPADPLGARQAAVHAGAELVRAALAKLPKDNGQLELFGEAEPEPPPDPDDPDDPEGWAADVSMLLAERAAALAARPEVALPRFLSVSQLVELADDPEALAARLRRPMPFPPNPYARRGTAFHAWLEQRFGATRLLDLDELPGAGDEGAAPDTELDELRAAFLASDWADRRPTEVEVPFETVLYVSDDGGGTDGAGVDGTVLRGRMDAVFADPDGGWTVVDWKTGSVPDQARLPALAVQLAAYRLAWAALADCPVDRVRAAFHYVRADVTLRPADLLDADGLRRLLRTVPSAGD
ncbi:ATP-dependent DNA helicase [Pseudonocardia eucalypti]|uniref:DNA 3'-5' helicase n=1 Tax=Pseudonocardia eucalypti TaxID=648755 RepID=A0ABP9Q8L7_9PSEU|nr:DNA helicase-2/ATP-dependent DNA helicase PcrA [Pseudonocardia eucalypti]